MHACVICMDYAWCARPEMSISLLQTKWPTSCVPRTSCATIFCKTIITSSHCLVAIFSKPPSRMKWCFEFLRCITNLIIKSGPITVQPSEILRQAQYLSVEGLTKAMLNTMRWNRSYLAAKTVAPNSARVWKSSHASCGKRFVDVQAHFLFKFGSWRRFREFRAWICEPGGVQHYWPLHTLPVPRKGVFWNSYTT